MSLPRPTLIKLPALSALEKEDFEPAGLYCLYQVMQTLVDEKISKEAIEGYNKSKKIAKIKGVIVLASRKY